MTWVFVVTAYVSGVAIGLAATWGVRPLSTFRLTWAINGPTGPTWFRRLYSSWIGRGCDHVGWGAVEPVHDRAPFGWACMRCGAHFAKEPAGRSR